MVRGRDHAWPARVDLRQLRVVPRQRRAVPRGAALPVRGLRRRPPARLRRPSPRLLTARALARTAGRARRGTNGERTLHGAAVLHRRAMVSTLFDPTRWEPVAGFSFSDVTYHRARNLGAVRIAFHRPEVRNAFRPQTVDE